MKKVLITFGTRPEAIKMAPIYNKFKNCNSFETKVCVTAQHREMLDQVLSFFKIKPDYDLDLMKKNQDIYNLTSEIILHFKNIMIEYDPDYVFIHGDTTTTMACGIVAYYSKSTICHIEAGLRSFNKYSPFPEEINRSVVTKLADYHFAPTEEAKTNLLNENISEETILVTGNTVIDSLLYSISKVDCNNNEIQMLNKKIDGKKHIILVTGHRRENFGKGFENICKAIKHIATMPNIQVIYPVHLNPNVKEYVYNSLSEINNILLIEPLTYEAFIWLMNKSKLILTDSGGVQEEAPSLGKPVLVMRDNTERPEAIKAGTVKLVGTNYEKIINEVRLLLDNSILYNQMSNKNNPYGNGTAANKILDFMLNNN